MSGEGLGGGVLPTTSAELAPISGGGAADCGCSKASGAGLARCGGEGELLGLADCGGEPTLPLPAADEGAAAGAAPPKLCIGTAVGIAPSIAQFRGIAGGADDGCAGTAGAMGGLTGGRRFGKPGKRPLAASANAWGPRPPKADSATCCCCWMLRRLSSSRILACIAL